MLFKKKGVGDTVTIFLKCIILNYFNERLVYIGFTRVKILPGQAAVFVSFFGKKKAFKICFWEKVGKQWNYFPYEPVDTMYWQYPHADRGSCNSWR